MVLLVTKRLRDDIRSFARAASLSIGDATEIALDRVTYDCERRISLPVSMSVSFADSIDDDVRRHLEAGATRLQYPPNSARHARCDG